MLLIAACLLLSCAQETPREQVASELDGLHLAAALADGAAYFEHFTPDATFLGTDADERWSIEQFRAYAQPFFERGQGWTYLATERHIRLSAAGDVAWFDERLQNEKYGEVRGSGVLERLDTHWKIAQYNLSFPVPNDLTGVLHKKAEGHFRVGQPVADEFVVEDGERSLFVWNKVVPPGPEQAEAQRPVVVLLPTASFSARAVWDLPLRDYSVMEAMARRGFEVFERPTRVIDERVAQGDFVADQFEPDVPEAFTRFLFSQSRRAPIGALLDYVHELPVCQPEQLKMPVLMIYGRSEFVPPTTQPKALANGQKRRHEQRRFFSRLAGHKRWIEVPGAGHMAHLDRAHRLLQACVIGWMERL